MWIHMITGIAICLLSFLYIFLGIKMKKWKIGSSWHDILGMVDLILIGVLDAQGLSMRWLNNRLKWRTPWILNIRWVHRLLAYFLIIISQAALLTGSLSISRRGVESNPWFIAHLVFFFLFWVFVEGYYQRNYKKETPYVEPNNIIS